MARLELCVVCVLARFSRQSFFSYACVRIYCLIRARKSEMAGVAVGRGVPDGLRLALLRGRAWVSGKWVEAASKNTFPVINPANGQVIAEVGDHDDSKYYFLQCFFISDAGSGHGSFGHKRGHRGCKRSSASLGSPVVQGHSSNSFYTYSKFVGIIIIIYKVKGHLISEIQMY